MHGVGRLVGYLGGGGGLLLLQQVLLQQVLLRHLLPPLQLLLRALLLAIVVFLPSFRRNFCVELLGDLLEHLDRASVVRLDSAHPFMQLRHFSVSLRPALVGLGGDAGVNAANDVGDAPGPVG